MKNIGFFLSVLILSSCSVAPKNMDADLCPADRSVSSAGSCAQLFESTKMFSEHETATSSVNSTIKNYDDQFQQLQAQITSLETELNLPEDQRAEKDPRWFAKWRNAEKNPVTIRLKDQIALLKTEQQGKLNHLNFLKENRADFVKLGLSLDQLLADIINLKRSQVTNDPALNSRIHMWLTKEYRDAQVRLGWLLRDIQIESRLLLLHRLQGIEGIEGIIASTTEIILEFKNSKVSMATFKKINKSFDFSQVRTTNDYARKIIGEGLYDTIVINLIKVASSSRTPMRKILEVFKEIKVLASEKRDGLIDTPISMITSSAVVHGKTASEALDVFMAMDRLAKNSKPSFSIADNEAAVLTELALSTGKTPEKIIQKLIELKEAISLHNLTKKRISVDDQALIYLTDYCIRTKGVSTQKLIAKIQDAFNLSETTKNNFYIHDLGVAILLVTSEKTQKSLEQMNKKYFKILDKLDETKPMINEAVAHYAEILMTYDIKTNDFTDLVNTVNKLVPKATIATKKGILGRALFAAGKELPTKNDLMFQAALSRQIPDKMTDWLIHVGVQKETSPGHTSDLGSPSIFLNYESSSSSSQSNSAPEPESEIGKLNFSFAGDGTVKTTMTAAPGGIGLDLKDGSITINTGYLTIDTDGSGNTTNFPTFTDPFNSY